MAKRYFPIRLPSGKALEADQSNLTIKEYQVGRDCQLWFTVNDTIRSKRHPKKAITVEDGWNDRGWGTLYLHPTGNLQLKTQKWKFADNGEIFSLCRNTRRLDALKLARIRSEIFHERQTQTLPRLFFYSPKRSMQLISLTFLMFFILNNHPNLTLLGGD